MSLKKKIENMILSRSNSYLFYKNQYEKNIANKKNSDPNVEKQFKKLKKEFEDFKRNTDDRMDSASFLFNNIFVDYELNEPRNVLKYIQDLSAELLIFTSRICEKNEIRYWLDYGNLLGAVRHGNFIPWYDEVDIGMMREDYIKFKEIISKEIEKNDLSSLVKVEFKQREINDNVVDSFIQILVKHKTWIGGDEESVLSILNVFPYDYLTEYNKKTIKKIYSKSKANLFNNLSNNMDFKDCLDKYYEELNLSWEPADYIIPGVEGFCGGNDFYKLSIFNADKIFPLVKVDFAGELFNAPNDFKYYLKAIYDDYLNLPKIVPRREKASSFRYNKDNDEVFGECINKLKDANAKL